MPVLGLAVLAGGCFVAGGTFMWWFQAREFAKCDREIQQQRAINRRLLRSLERYEASR